MNDGQKAVKTMLGGRLGLYVGDLVRHGTAAIVNAANSSLLGGGGVDGAIHAAAGEVLTEACRHLRRTTHADGLPTGEVVITPGGRLPAKFVIHTVGPVYGRHGGCEAQLLAACYRNALDLARREGLQSLAFPLISTGVYGYPLAEAARVVFATLAQALQEDRHFSEIRLVFYRNEQLQTFLAALPADS